MKEDTSKNNWFKKHADTITILGTFALCFWHLNEKITSLDKDMAVVKTVLIMQKIMPSDLAIKEDCSK